MNNDVKLLFFILGICIYSSSLLILNYKDGRAETIYIIDENQVKRTNSSDIFFLSKVSCGSSSMNPTLNCKDDLHSRFVLENEKLVEGRIYKYWPLEKNRFVVHRLIKCLDENCTKLIFKGDSNLIADKEIVSRNQVEQEIFGISYGDIK